MLVLLLLLLLLLLLRRRRRRRRRARLCVGCQCLELIAFYNSTVVNATFIQISFELAHGLARHSVQIPVGRPALLFFLLAVIGSIQLK